MLVVDTRTSLGDCEPFVPIDEPELGRPRYVARPYATESTPRGPEGLVVPGGDAAPLTEPAAIHALVFALLSFVVLPLIGAIVALRLSARAGSRIENADGALDGVGLALAARRLAWANIVIVGLLLAYVVLPLLVGIQHVLRG